MFDAAAIAAAVAIALIPAPAGTCIDCDAETSGMYCSDHRPCGIYEVAPPAWQNSAPPTNETVP